MPLSSAAPIISSRQRPASRGLIERDAGLLAHPYAPVDEPPLFAVEAASGARLTLRDADGTSHEVIDGMASWWSAIHGYRHPRLDAAARGQLEHFSHVMFGGLTHAPAVELAERLTALAPGGLPHVFLADSGSVSVEVALKLAVQVQSARNRPQRQRFLSLRGGYHGDTTGAMGLCDPIDGMHASFDGLLARHEFLPVPPAGSRDARGEWSYDAQQLEQWRAQTTEILQRHEGELAGIIVEPVVQGAGGMRWYPPAVLRILRDLADRWDLLLIADEIATGFGRTGSLFACDQADVVPDILCVGKALTGGYLTLAAVLFSERVGATLKASEHGAILHGPTFMGNPLACAIACASLDELGVGAAPEASWARHIQRLEGALRTGLAPARSLNSVSDVRVLGGIGVLELSTGVDARRVSQRAVKYGAWVRPFRNLVYVMPPYVTSDAELGTLTNAMVHAVAEVHG